MRSRLFLVLTLLVALVMVLSACGSPAPEAPAAGGEAAATEVPAADTGAAADAEELTLPHPILSDIRVRKAIAHCVDRDSLIASVYPYVSDEEKPKLRMDTNLPKSHWAYSGPYTDYAYDPDGGMALLEEAGWTLPSGGSVRENANGDSLALSLTTTNAQFRQTWAAVAEQNLAACGFEITRRHEPASWWFGDTTGLQVRDFELGAFAWVGQADPSGQTLYACNQIPTPENNYEGQNYMGWCNQDASDAIVLANNTLSRDERIAAYDTFQKYFSEDMVSLPLFQRAEAEAWSLNLQGLVIDPTEYGTASAADWTLADGGDTVIIGFSQEPASLFRLVESAAVASQVAQMGVGLGVSQYSYDFQPALQAELSTIEAGLATNEMVAVAPGDTVYSADAEPEELAAGTRILSGGAVVEYDGSSELELPQLIVTYHLNPYTWSDGTPGSIEDVKLATEFNCNEENGATDYNTCRSIQEVEYNEAADGIEWTVTYLPGAQSPTYYLMPWATNPTAPIYPSHQVLSDGRMLADVPAAEWRTLPEIAEQPLSWGPFMVTEWRKGQSLTLERNPYYDGETGVERIIIVFVTDTNQAVAQLLSGDVDYLERATLGGGAEVQTLVDAAAEDKVNIEILPSPTWEHIDMNMFVK